MIRSLADFDFIFLPRHIVLAPGSDPKAERAWLPLFNPNRVSCSGTTCNGQLFWTNAAPFTAIPGYSVNVPAPANVCLVVHEATKVIKDLPCRYQAVFYCEYDCGGSGAVGTFILPRRFVSGVFKDFVFVFPKIPC